MSRRSIKWLSLPTADVGGRVDDERNKVHVIHLVIIERMSLLAAQPTLVVIALKFRLSCGSDCVVLYDFDVATWRRERSLDEFVTSYLEVEGRVRVPVCMLSTHDSIVCFTLLDAPTWRYFFLIQLRRVIAINPELEK